MAAAGAAEDNSRLLGERMPYAKFDRLPATRLELPGGELIVAFAPGTLELPPERVLDWVGSSARAVSAYYGRFPVASAQLLIVPRSGQGVGSGKAWNYRRPAVRIALGGQATEEHLRRDWILVHEMVHLAFPPVAVRHNWIQEGLASYIEAVARAQAGQITPEQVWFDLVSGLPKGLPQTGDRGLDHTPTWGRTYWGGALYTCSPISKSGAARATASACSTRCARFLLRATGRPGCRSSACSPSATTRSAFRC